MDMELALPEATMLAQLVERRRQISEVRHALAREDGVLASAATQLRLGRSGRMVIAMMEESLGALMPKEVV